MNIIEIVALILQWLRSLLYMSIAELTVLFLPWIISTLTLYQVFLAGNKSSKAWLQSMFNQALWLIWIITSKNWGLIPLNIGMWFFSIRNHFKWKREEE